MKHKTITGRPIIALHQPDNTMRKTTYNLDSMMLFLEDNSPAEIYAFLEAMELCLVEHAELVGEKDGQSERFLNLRQIKNVFGQISESVDGDQ